MAAVEGRATLLRRGVWKRRAVQFLGLTGLAIAEPLLSLLRAEPTYLVAHDATGWRVVALALLVVLVPAAAAVGVVALVSAVSRRAGDVDAFLDGITALQPVNVTREPGRVVLMWDEAAAP